MKHKKTKALLKWLGIISLFVLALLLIGYIKEPFAEKSDAKAYPPSGMLVDIGGYSLHIYCKGSGSPTVVIESGLGDWSSSWKNVQDKVAKKNRVCTYDRAGLGWSDTGQKPRTAKQFSKELHTLLQKSNISDPIVLVGHSSGGFTARVYSHEFPNQISGIVLVDSMSPKQFTTVAINSHESSNSQNSSPYTLLARFGIIRTITNLLGLLENASPEEKASYALQSTPKFVQAFIDENEGVQVSAHQASQIKTLGNIPIIVLSRGLDNTDNKSWSSMQRELLTLSSHSAQLIAESSSHYVQLDQPDVVVATINKMVNTVRKE